MSVVTCGVCLAQTDAHMSCISRLEIPAYPGLATQARIESGSIRVSVELGDAGSVQKIRIDSKSTHKGLFEREIQTSMGKSSFLQSCRGQTVGVVFKFTLGDGPRRETVAFRYPNEFWITAVAPHWEPQASQRR